MKKNIILSLLILFLSSCHLQEKIQASMDSWIGHTKQEVIMSWGPPARSCSDGANGEIIIYSKPILISGVYYYYNTLFYINKESKVYHWLKKTETVPPEQLDINIYHH